MIALEKLIFDTLKKKLYTYAKASVTQKTQNREVPHAQDSRWRFNGW